MHMEWVLVGGVLHIARLQQELMFLSVYTVLPSPRTSLTYFPVAILSPHTALHPPVHRAIHQGARARSLASQAL